jgi:hypoxanthine phosphoribosyltransferase
MGRIMSFPIQTFPNDDMEYITPSWDELQDLSFQIAGQIRAEGMHFDRIVTLAKGGWPMTRCLVDFLNVHEVASIGVKFYSGLAERFERPRIYQDLPVAVVDERVLLFDDVADTGASLKFTRDYLLHYRGVANVTTATLMTKPHSVIRPDFSGADTTAWIIFPYDAAEMIETLGERWNGMGVSQEEMAERFAVLGFRAEWIEAFIKAPA